MSEEKKSILDRFEKKDELYLARKEVMSFEDYIDEVYTNPLIPRNSFQRVYDMIISFGNSPSGKIGNPELPRYHFFNDRFDLSIEKQVDLKRTDYGPDAIFGIEDSMEEFVSFLKGAAQGKNYMKRFLLMLGPVASAKSTLANLLKKGYEHYTSIDSGKMYAFDWVNIPRTTREEMHEIIDKDSPCPMNEDPLALLPQDIRNQFLKEINKKTDAYHRIKLEGDSCPPCMHLYDRLMKVHEGDWKKVLKEHIRVRRLIASEDRRVAIGTFKPKDEKNQDSTELTGDTNFLTMQAYGDEAHPLAFSHSGEFDKANRGFLEWVEIIKLNEEFLYELLDGTQDRKIKPKNQPNIRIDQILFGHTNVPEFEKLRRNESQEAFRNRIYVVNVPYNLELSEEIKIYEKEYGHGMDQDGKHIAPHTIYSAALFAVLTRLKHPEKHKLSLMDKLKLYDGKVVDEWNTEHVKELMKAAAESSTQKEGLFGVSPRVIQNTLDGLLSKSRYNGKCINPLMLFNELEFSIEHDASINENLIDKYKHELLTMVVEEYKNIAKNDLMKAISSDESAMKELFEKYVNHVRASHLNEKVKDKYTEQEEPADEKFMRRLEERMNISEEAAQGHRMTLMAYMNKVMGEDREFDFKSDERLYKGLQLELFEQKKGSIDLTKIANPDKFSNEEEKGKFNVLMKRLTEPAMGYCNECAEKLIRYAGKAIQD